MDLSQIVKLVNEGRMEEAENLLEIFEGNGDVTFWLLAAKIFAKQQKWGQVINSCQKVLTIDPGNREATIQIEIAKNILNYRNPEMYNA